MASQDYAKMKNADLEQLLKERNLPAGGKKADMVARLQEADKQPAAPTVPDAKPAGSDAAETAQASTQATKPAEANSNAPANGQSAAVVASQKPGEASAEGSEENKKLTKEERAALQEQKKAEREAQREENEKKYTSGIRHTDIHAEIAQRKKRAEKFGMSAEADEAIKKLERSLKFDTGVEVAADGDKKVSGLDTALPAERERKKRGPGDDGGGRGGKRARGGRAGADGGSERVASKSGGGGSNWMSEADRQAAEKRKSRFATSA